MHEIGSNKKEDVENYVVRRFIICTLNLKLLNCKSVTDK